MKTNIFTYFCNSIILSAIVLLLSAQSIYALAIPTFPSCINPQGEKIVYYSDGVHGVPADSTTYTGSDAVYRVSDTTLLQCLCLDDGRGIQTNWWKAGTLTQAEINSQINNEWKYVPNGLAWGLTDDPYLIKNISYSCLNKTSGNGGVGGGSVLGLASTGNITTIIFYSISGIVLILVGLYLKENYDNRNI